MRLPFCPTTYIHYRTKSSLSPLTFLKPAPLTPWGPMDAAATTLTNCRHLKIVVIMGATGSGKSRLSIDLATRFFNPSEIVNADKMQVYRGLDITTNKIPMRERLGVTHHLVGEFDPSESDITPCDYRKIAGSVISGILSKRRLPLIVGGSNSFIYGLLAKRFEPGTDAFDGSDPVSNELRYNCCFLWVDVSMPVLHQYLSKRVDEMLDSGMFEELEEFYDSGEFRSVSKTGLGQAIGVPEFERYFNTFRFRMIGKIDNDAVRQARYDEAVRLIKDNTCQLARRQIRKIQRLRDAGWDLQRVDATEAFRAAMTPPGYFTGVGHVADVWERRVVEPSVKIVKQFLDGGEKSKRKMTWSVGG